MTILIVCAYNANPMETEITKLIKKMRIQAGLTQTQLAALIGTPRYNISKYESGKSMPPGDILLAIQKIANKQPDTVSGD